MKLEFEAADGGKKMTLDDLAKGIEQAKAMGADGGRVPKVRINLDGTIMKINVEF